jgi:putative ABC transport system substrate-binding protein
MIERRALLAGAGAALARPFASGAQQPASKRNRIGYLGTAPATQHAADLAAFRKALQDLGYVEGKSYVVEYRSADGHNERYPKLAAELISLNVDVIVTRGTPAALAVKAATTTIPVVMVSAAWPVESGLVASLARPGGNITGLSSFGTELAAKRVELIKDMLPRATRIGFICNLTNPAASLQWEETQRGARALGFDVEPLDVRNVSDIGRAFETAVAHQIGALLGTIDSLFVTHSQLIVDLAARHKLPVVYGSREFVDAGGLISYRVSWAKLHVRAASMVDKVLKGTKPADIPVEQPTTLEMVINLKTAKALGITIPDIVMIRADEVIE